jgi:predicted TIM-barrel fold metal-dependent hydrolase
MYEQLWAAFAETDLTINTHGNGAFQNNFFGTDEPWLSSVPADVVANETTYFNAQRTMNHLISAGVFERYPDLRFAITEVGPTAYWVKHKLRDLDFLEARSRSRELVNQKVGRKAPFAKPVLSRKPSEYFARNVFLGVSFMERSDAEVRYDFGVDRIMWGADFPHHEGTYPYTREALRATFYDVPANELRAMLGETAAIVYGFDMGALRDVAAKIGPTVDEIAQPLPADQRPSYPDQTQCMALAPSSVIPY